MHYIHLINSKYPNKPQSIMIVEANYAKEIAQVISKGKPDFLVLVIEIVKAKADKPKNTILKNVFLCGFDDEGSYPDVTSYMKDVKKWKDELDELSDGNDEAEI